MVQTYYNGDRQVSKEEFDKERARIISQRFKETENKDNLINDEDLDYYLAELRKFWDR